jgi:hypothetical protein
MQIYGFLKQFVAESSYELKQSLVGILDYYIYEYNNILLYNKYSLINLNKLKKHI